MNIMIEKAARAINKKKQEFVYGKEIIDFDKCDINYQKQLKAQAKAAIEAMREPTEEMLNKMAGFNLHNSSAMRTNLLEEWKNGIDAALKEE